MGVAHSARGEGGGRYARRPIGGNGEWAQRVGNAHAQQEPPDRCGCRWNGATGTQWALATPAAVRSFPEFPSPHSSAAKGSTSPLNPPVPPPYRTGPPLFYPLLSRGRPILPSNRRLVFSSSLIHAGRVVALQKNDDETTRHDELTRLGKSDALPRSPAPDFFDGWGKTRLPAFLPLPPLPPLAGLRLGRATPIPNDRKARKGIGKSTREEQSDRFGLLFGALDEIWGLIAPPAVRAYRIPGTHRRRSKRNRSTTPAS